MQVSSRLRRVVVTSLACLVGMVAVPWLAAAPGSAQAQPQSQLQARGAASAAPDQLQAFIRQVPAAAGRFVQTTHDRDGQTVARQRGEFAFARPGRFRWQVTEPFAQLIVANGREVVQFDPDLNQATIRPVSAAVGNAPAQILFGEGDIDQAFVMAPLPDRDGLAWLRATPRSAEAGFSHLDIGLRDGLPVQVEILDAFGQISRIEFVTLVPSERLPDSTFVADLPPGTDVVRMP